MSKTVDERVVSMQFDNRHFENNVQTTLSTLDKLKQKLNLPGATKSLENIGTAAKKVDLNPLSQGVEAVRVKFSALQIMGVTALQNITNQALNAGKRITSALTIDPVKTGFSEYETKINSIQTIMSNTASKGTTMEDVTRVIDELNTYADKTIYNFAEMTRNIGTFTAAGVGLQESADAIQGIANLAAASGSTSQQASTAMYQLSQALAAGTVKLMDWNSVVNAGMGGEKFQEALKATAREMGISVDAIIEKNGSFRDSLQDGWITADVLNTTLQKFTKKGAKDYAKAMLESGQYTQEQADALLKEAESMEDAATKVKTFTQLIDTLKESLQSGWGKTWEILIGDFEEAKELFTGISDFIGGFINKMSDARNNLLEGALSHSPFGKLSEKIESVTTATEKVTQATKDYADIVDRVMGGEFGSGQARWDKLTEAGYDWAHVQNLVNEKMGNSTRHATDYAEAQNRVAEAQNGVSESQATTIEQLMKMSDAQLKNLEFTDDEIKAFRELEKQSEKTGIPIKDLIDDMDQLSGRSLLINSFKNAGKGLVSIFESLGKAWREVFPPMTSEQLYNIIAAIHKFSTNLVVSDKSADKLRRTFKGLFAVIDIIATITGGALSIAFKIVCRLLKIADVDILSVTASVGDAIVAFRDWLFVNGIFAKALDKVLDAVVTGILTIKKWIKAFIELPAVQRAIDKFKSSAVLAFKNTKEFVLDSIDTIGDLIKKLMSLDRITLSDIIDIFKEFKEKGLGALSKIGEKFDWLGEKISDFVNVIRSKFDIGDIIALGIGAGIIAAIFKIKSVVENVVDAITGPVDAITNLIDSVSNVFDKFAGVLKAKAWEIRAKAVMNLAIAIAILAASLVILTKLNQDNLWSAVGALSVLTLTLAALAFAMGKIGKLGDFGKVSIALISLSGSLFLLVKCLQIMDGLDSGKAVGNVIILALLSVTLAAFAAAITKFAPSLTKGTFALMGVAISLGILVSSLMILNKLNISTTKKSIPILLGLMVGLALVAKASSGVNFGAGFSILAIVIALKILVGAIEDIADIDTGKIQSNLDTFLIIFAGFAAVMIASKFAGQHAAKGGVAILAMSIALAILVTTFEKLGNMDQSVLKRATDVVSDLLLTFAAIVLLSKFAGQHAIKAGVMLLLMSGAMLMLLAMIAVLKMMNPEGLDRAMAVIVTLGILFGALIGITKLAKNVKGTLIVLTVAIGLMVGCLIGLSFIKPANLAAATVALTSIIGVFALLIKMTQYLKSGQKTFKRNIATLASLTLIIGVLALIIGLLSRCNPGSALAASTALSIMLAALSSSLLIISNSKSMTEKKMKTMLTMLGALTGVVAVLAVIISVMSLLNVGNTIAIATSLSTLLMSLSAACAILSYTGPLAGKAIGTAYAMAGVVAVLAIVLGVMDKLNVAPSVETATALSILLLALSGACVILGIAGATAGAALAGIGVLAVLIVAVGALMIGLGALMEYVPNMEEFLDNGITVLGKIGTALGSFIGGIVGGIAAGAMSGLPKIGESLSAFIDSVKPFLDGCKNIDPSAMSGAKALAETILILAAANIIESIAAWATGESSMESFADQLIPFGEAITQFSSIIAGNVDGAAVEAAANAGKMMAEMASTIPNSGGLLGKVLGENDMDDFGAKLVPFGDAIVKFSTIVKGKVDESAVKAAANAGKMMAEMASTIPNSGGLLGFFCGENDIDDFGAKLVPFGDAIVKFSSKVKGNVDESAILAAANAGKMMTEMAATIPNTGGLVSWFTGDNDLATFGEKLAPFGKAIVGFSNEVTGNINESAITAAANAGQVLANLANNIPKEGGITKIIDALPGTDNDMESFSKGIVAFGKAMVEFSSTVSGENAINADAVNAAANAGLALTKMSESVPSRSAFDQFCELFGGDNDMESFAKGFKAFGKAIKSFSTSVTGIDVETTEVGARVGKMLAETIPSVDFNALTSIDMEVFAAKVTEYGKAIVSFCKTLQESKIDTSQIYLIASAGDAVSQMMLAIPDVSSKNMMMFGSHLVSFGSSLKVFVTDLNGLDFDSISGKVDSLKATLEKLVGINMDQIKESIYNSKADLGEALSDLLLSAVSTDNTSEAIEKYKSTGSNMVVKLTEGMTAKEGKIKESFKSMNAKALQSVRNAANYNNFYSAGSYLVDGFCAGISANDYKAGAKAAAMAKKAYNAAKEELDVNSPSKVFRKLGVSVPEGFIMGIDKLANQVKGKASSMADMAINGTKNAISRIASVVNTDIDSQPTIRPVLDLSDVSAGVGVMNGMFDMSPSVGVMSNVRSISSSMNNRSQNGGNDDVISAIKDLKNSISTSSGNTYSINGVTYDDGSNVADAVQSLIRAARIERRM